MHVGADPPVRSTSHRRRSSPHRGRVHVVAHRCGDGYREGTACWTPPGPRHDRRATRPCRLATAAHRAPRRASVTLPSLVRTVPPAGQATLTVHTALGTMAGAVWSARLISTPGSHRRDLSLHNGFTVVATGFGVVRQRQADNCHRADSRTARPEPSPWWTSQHRPPTTTPPQANDWPQRSRPRTRHRLSTRISGCPVSTSNWTVSGRSSWTGTACLPARCKTGAPAYEGLAVTDCGPQQGPVRRFAIIGDTIAARPPPPCADHPTADTAARPMCRPLNGRHSPVSATQRPRQPRLGRPTVNTTGRPGVGRPTADTTRPARNNNPNRPPSGQHNGTHPNHRSSRPSNGQLNPVPTAQRPTRTSPTDTHTQPNGRHSSQKPAQRRTQSAQRRLGNGSTKARQRLSHDSADANPCVSAKYRPGCLPPASHLSAERHPHISRATINSLL